MTSPQDRINEKLEETRTVSNKAEEQLAKLGVPFYVQSLQTSSFQQRIQDLTKEQEDVKNVLDKEEVVLSLHPSGLPPGQISVKGLTVILGGLQDLSDSIANTLFNQPSEKGKIPQEILD